MIYFIDWLEIEQDFGVEIPEVVLRSIFDFGMIGVHLDTGEMQSGIRTGTYHHKGSYCDKVSIKISGSVKHFTIDSHCELLEEQRQLIQAIFGILWAFIALRHLLTA